MFYFHPDPWGFMIQFDYIIFFNCLENIGTYHFFRQLWLVLGVKLRVKLTATTVFQVGWFNHQLDFSIHFFVGNGP